MKKILCFNSMVMILIVVFCGVFSAAAKDITFQADVDRTTVELGSYARLTLTVTGVEGLEQAIELPEIDGLESRLIGPQSRVSIVNGQYSSSYSLVYILYPSKTGRFTIPAISLTVDGQAVKSQPIEIEVVSSQAAVPAAASSSGGGVQQNAEQSLSERIFVVMGTPKEEVYTYERFPLTVKLFVNNLNIRNVSYPQIEPREFVLDDFEQPTQYEQVINGIRYQVVEFKTFAYAMQAGELELGPVRETCQLAVKSEGRQQSGFGSFFDDDFFNDFFDRNYVLRPLALESESLKLKVKTLPDEGKPEAFSGAVGKFALDVTVSPSQVSVGDPVTVRMTLAGNGNMRTAELPAFRETRDFKVYDPQITVKGSVKVLEQVIIPKHGQVKAVPAVSFWSFDPGVGRYVEETSGPFTLDVKSAEQGAQAQVVGLHGAGIFSNINEQDKLGKDIGFIKDRPGRFYKSGYRPWRSGLFIMSVCFILFVWGGGYFWYQFYARLKTDEHFARRLKAPQYARSGLESAKAFLRKRDARQFYDTVHTTIQQYFSHKLHMPPGDISASSIRKYLQGMNIDDEVMRMIARLLSNCDEARYASVDFGHERMTRAFQDLQNTIDQIERKCR